MGGDEDEAPSQRPAALQQRNGLKYGIKHYGRCDQCGDTLTALSAPAQRNPGGPCAAPPKTSTRPLHRRDNDEVTTSPHPVL